MGPGLFHPLSGTGRSAQCGHSMLELALATGISGLLALAGLARLDPGHIELDAAQNELVESLDQAFVLARARGSNVTVSLGSGSDPNHLPIRLGRRIRWGKPRTIPLPRGMDEPRWAGGRGEAHPSITVTPRHTATASLWFLNDGTEAVCMRLSGRGRLQLLRWRSAPGRWVRVE